MRQQVIRQPLQLHRIFDRVNEQHLVQPVIQRHAIRPDGLKAADRHRVCHHTVDEIVLHLRFRAVHADVVGFDVGQRLNALDDIRSTPENVLGLLRCLIGDLSKRTERRNIVKIAIVEAANIQRLQRIACRNNRRLSGHLGNAQTEREVVCRTGRHITENRTGLRLHKTGNHLIQRTVTACTHNAVELARTLPCNTRCILRTLRDINRHIISCLLKCGYAADDLSAHCTASRMRIEYPQHSLHVSSPSGFVHK